MNLATKQKQNLLSIGSIFFAKNIQKKGFTLVEMLIVVIIIGILASALIPRMMNVMSNARDSARLTDITSLANALEIYYNNEGVYIERYYDKGSNLIELKKNMLLTSLPTDPQKYHLNYGTRNYDDKNGRRVGEYNYIATSGRLGKPKPYLGAVGSEGFLGYILTFSPENFSKGNMINPYDPWADNPTLGNMYKYGFDGHSSPEFYKMFLCNGKIEIDKNFNDSTTHFVNNYNYDSTTSPTWNLCKTSVPERVIYARFSDN